MVVTVVIPCYNVEDHIAVVIENIPPEITWIIAVNDCSTDNTEQILLRLCKGNDRIQYVRHKQNQGVGGAMITGFKKAIELKSEIIIKMDGDDQMDPRDIPKLVSPLKSGQADYTKRQSLQGFQSIESNAFCSQNG